MASNSADQKNDQEFGDELKTHINDFVQKQKQLLAEIESLGSEQYIKNLINKWREYLVSTYGENYKTELIKSCGTPIQVDDTAPNKVLNQLDDICLSYLLGNVDTMSDTFIITELDIEEENEEVLITKQSDK